MKRLKVLIWIFLLMVSTSWAYQNVICYDVNGRFTDGAFNGAFDPPAYAGRPCDFDPDFTAALSTPSAYWIRRSPGLWEAMTGVEQTVVINAAINATTATITTQALNNVDAFDSINLAQRGFALVTLDEINTLREWITTFKADVAAATSLTDLKTRVAAEPNFPDRTPTQLKNAVKTKISSGGAN